MKLFQSKSVRELGKSSNAWIMPASSSCAARVLTRGRARLKLQCPLERCIEPGPARRGTHETNLYRSPRRKISHPHRHKLGVVERAECFDRIVLTHDAPYWLGLR